MMVKKESRQTAGTRFEEAAERVAAEIRRLDDVGDDVRREVRQLRWTGRSAEQFRRDAGREVTRTGQNRELLEALRVLLIRAAQTPGAPTGGRP